VPQSPSPPEFFVDRSLGAHDLARALRDAGWTLRTHLEVYGDRDEEVADAEWLELCGREGWPALTMDRRIRYRTAEIAAIREHSVRAFALTSGNLIVAEQAERFVRRQDAIFAACETQGPFIYAVHADRIVRVFPT
jgi:hypothetical protein